MTKDEQKLSHAKIQYKILSFICFCVRQQRGKYLNSDFNNKNNRRGSGFSRKMDAKAGQDEISC